MRFSILIPSIPSRFDRARALYEKLDKQTRGKAVEILMLTDNKQRSIGKKREFLVKLAQGEYVAFVDDDDDVSDNYVERIHWTLTHISNRVDVIAFPTSCMLPHFSSPATVHHSLKFENEQPRWPEFKRKPWHVHLWRRSLVQEYSFPDISYGEDWGWVKQFVDKAKIEVILNCKPLYHYTFDPKVSEADNNG